MTRQDSRNKLIRHSTELFYTRGYADTTIRQIGQKTGMNSANIYYYFKDKEGLLFEIIKDAADDILEKLIEVEKSISEPLAGFKALLREHLRLHLITYRKETKIWAIDFYWLKPKNRDAIKGINRKIYNLFKEKFMELNDRKLMRNFNSAVAFNSIEGIISWNIQWTKEHGKLTREEVVDEIERVILEGFLI